jgi:curli production assembly/transport component CsgG
VVQSVNVSKTLYSVKLQSNVFKFVGVDEILELEAGITANEPTQVAVRQAIEASVYSLIAEGALEGLWDFQNQQAGQEFLNTYRELKSSEPKPVQEARQQGPQDQDRQEQASRLNSAAGRDS